MTVTTAPSPTSALAPPARSVDTAATIDVDASRRFLFVAVASLVASGVLALVCVLGRMPPFDQLVTDPELFRRCLVVHVDLALVVWFYAFLVALWLLIPSRSGQRRIVGLGVFLTSTGVWLLLSGMFLPSKNLGFRCARDVPGEVPP